MSNKTTTWELKAVDNLPDVITRMKQVADLLEQQAKLSSSVNNSLSQQLNSVTANYKSVESSIKEANAAIQQQATETQKVKERFDALKTTVTPLTTVVNNVFAGAKAKTFADDIVKADSRLEEITNTLKAANTQTKSFANQDLSGIIADINKYANDAKAGFEKIKSATADAKEEDKRYQQQVENRAQIALNKMSAIQARAVELADKQSGLAEKERIETEALLKKKQELIDKIDKINTTYASLGVRTEKEQAQWDNALKKTYNELDKVESKIEGMPAKTAAENAKIEKQFGTLQNQVIGASNALSKAGEQLEQLGIEARKADGYIGQLQAQIAKLKEQRAFAQTEDEVKQINVQLEKLETKLKDVTGGAKQMEGGFGMMKGALAGALAYIGLSEIIDATKAVFNLIATWEKYQSTLKVALGSQDKANQALQMLQSYADKSNFELDELADTFSKFANRGLVMAKDNLEKVGDVANALGKPFKQLGEAILDINNTDRWNDLGIKAQTNGNKVALTFKGVTMEVDRTEQGVLRAITAFGTMNGVAGQTAEQAKTLGGRWSTLSDGVAGLGRAVGEILTPAFGFFIDVASETVSWLSKQFSGASALTPVFNVLGTTVKSLFGFFGELVASFNQATDGILPQLFNWLTNNGNAMKLFATIIQVAVVGPFQVLVLVFKEIWEVSKLAYNGFQGLISGLEAVGKALVLDFDGAKASINDASNYFTKAGQNFSNMKEMYTKTNADFTNSLKSIWAEAQTVAVKVDDINKNLTASQLKAVETENKRWESVSKGMKQGTGEYAQAYNQHLENLSKAEGTYIGLAVAGEKEKGDKKKAQAYLSAKELAVVVKDVQEQSLKEQLDLVDANAKLEIEKINQHKNTRVNTEAEAQAAIKKIIADAEIEKQKLISDNRAQIQVGQLEHIAKTVELETKLTSDVQASEVQRLLNSQLTAKERLKNEIETAAEVEKLRKKEQQVIEETAEIEEKAHNRRLKSIIGFLGEMSPQLAQFADFAIGVVDNIDIITGKSEQFYKKQAQDAETAMTTSKIFFGETSEQYNQAKLRSAEANKDLVEAQAKTSEVSMNMAMALADLVKKVFGMVSETVATSMDGILEGLDATSEAYQRFTDMSIDLNRQMIEITLKDTSLSFDEQKRMIDDFIKHENDTLYGNERMQNELNTAKNSVELAKWQADRQSEFITNLVKGPEGIIANWKLVFTWRQEQAAREEELARQQTIFENNQAIQRAQEQIATYKQMADEKIKIAEETRDKEIEAQKQTNVTIEKELELLDTKRKQLLDSWLARKLKDLEDDKQLALAQAATEEEKSNIIIKYQGLVEAAHSEYKDAELDKTKQVSLATTELKNQEKDFIKNKEEEAAKKIQQIQRETAAMVYAANRDIFEANKQIVIAELQGEIAKLKSKRWFLNAGRVDSAIASIEGTISQIQGAQFGGGMSTGGGVEENLGVNQKLEESGKRVEEIGQQAERVAEVTQGILQNALSTTDWLNNLANDAKNSLNAINEAKAQAEKPVELATGTDYVQGIGFPDGIDTVKAMLTKGERVVPVELNRAIGGASNEELVAKKLFADRVLAKTADMRTAFKFDTFLAPLPDFMLNGNSGGSDPRQFEAIADRIAEMINKPNININVKPNGVTVEEMGQKRQHTDYYHNTHYNRFT